MRSRRIVFVVFAVVATALTGVAAGAIVGPPNDDAANATVIGSVPFSATQSNAGATKEAGEVPYCNTPAEETVWFSYTATTDGTFLYTVSGDEWQPRVWTYKGNPGSTAGELTPWDYCGSEWGVLDAVAGTTYYFQVATYSGWTPTAGEFTFDFMDLNNQDFANAVVVSDLPVHARGANFSDDFIRVRNDRAAQPVTVDGLEPGEPQPCGAIGMTMWYRLDLGVDASMTANTYDVSGDLGNGPGPADASPRTNFDTVLAVYEGPIGATFDDLTLVGCNDDDGQGVSRVDFDGVAGTSYYFQVGGFNASSTYYITDLATGPVGLYDLTISALCAGEAATIVGTNGDDEIIGTDEADVIAGLSGNDMIDGLRGGDLICGDEGLDTLMGGQGRDWIYGGNHADDIYGGPGNDRLYGGRGFDLGTGGRGIDRCGTEVAIACGGGD